METSTGRIQRSTISAPAAYLAIAGALAATALLLALQFLSPEYSPAWRMVSEYANGRFAWVLSLMFLAYGLSSLSLAFAIRSQITSRSGRIGLAVLVVAGAAQAAAAVFDLNQVAVHELAGALGIVGLPIAAVLISRSLVRLEPWTPARKPILWTAHLTWVSVVLWMATFVVMVASFIHVLGGLPTSVPQEVPPGAIALVGWTNRLLVISAWAWVVTVAWQAVKFGSAKR
jgi:hypothetical protein